MTKWHKSVFLDELPEYKRSALEVMRQPLEDRKQRHDEQQDGSSVLRIGR